MIRDKGQNSVFICEECHKRDKNVVGCHATFDGHGGVSFHGVCDICGRLGMIRFCFAYSDYVNNGRIKQFREFEGGN